MGDEVAPSSRPTVPAATIDISPAATASPLASVIQPDIPDQTTSRPVQDSTDTTAETHLPSAEPSDHASASQPAMAHAMRDDASSTSTSHKPEESVHKRAVNGRVPSDRHTESQSMPEASKEVLQPLPPAEVQSESTPDDVGHSPAEANHDTELAAEAAAAAEVSLSGTGREGIAADTDTEPGAGTCPPIPNGKSPALQHRHVQPVRSQCPTEDPTSNVTHPDDASAPPPDTSASAAHQVQPANQQESGCLDTVHADNHADPQPADEQMAEMSTDDATGEASSAPVAAPGPLVRVDVTAAAASAGTESEGALIRDLVQVRCTVSDTAEHLAEPPAAGPPPDTPSHPDVAPAAGLAQPADSTNGAVVGTGSSSAACDGAVAAHGDRKDVPSHNAGGVGAVGGAGNPTGDAAAGPEGGAGQDEMPRAGIDGTGVAGVESLLTPEAGEAVHQFTDALSAQLGGWLWGNSAAGDDPASSAAKAGGGGAQGGDGAQPQGATTDPRQGVLALASVPGSGCRAGTAAAAAATGGDVVSAEQEAEGGAAEGGGGADAAGERTGGGSGAVAASTEVSALRDMIRAREAQLESQAEQLAEMQAAMGALQVCMRALR